MGASCHKEVTAFGCSGFHGFDRDKKAFHGFGLNSSEDGTFKSHGGQFTSLGIIDGEGGLEIVNIGDGEAT